MVEYVRECANHTGNKNAVHCLGKYIDPSSIESAGYALYKACYFRPHRKAQYLITPTKTLRDGLANCVDYTIFLSVWAKVNNLPCIIRVVQLNGTNDYGHVYPVISGVPVDLVIGQIQTGVEKYLRPFLSRPTIGKELPYIRALDFVVN